MTVKQYRKKHPDVIGQEDNLQVWSGDSCAGYAILAMQQLNFGTAAIEEVTKRILRLLESEDVDTAGNIYRANKKQGGKMTMEIANYTVSQILFDEGSGKLTFDGWGIHCGQILEVLLPDQDGGRWEPVSFETSERRGWYIPKHETFSPVGLWAREHR
jgi:hypothetical protein